MSLFTVSFFGFTGQQNHFFVGDKFLIQRKMMKVFSLISRFFSVGEKTCFVAFKFLFRRRNETLGNRNSAYLLVCWLRDRNIF